MLYPFVARWTYGWFSARRMPLFGDQGLPPAGDPYVAVVSITSDRLVSFGVPFGLLVRLPSLNAGPPNTQISGEASSLAPASSAASVCSAARAHASMPWRTS